MKTAISVPDVTFHRATQRARDLGWSRSEFFARAAERYLDQLDAESTTAQIDVVVESIAHADDSSESAVKRGLRVLEESSGDW